jgi:hypothetical protein
MKCLTSGVMAKKTYQTQSNSGSNRSLRPASRAEWPRRLEKLCREAEAHWRAAHPWVADPNMCVSVPIPRSDLPDPQGPR